MLAFTELPKAILAYCTRKCRRDMNKKKLVIVGQGYVGLPIAMRAVVAGYDVVGLDVDKVRVENLQEGVSYVEDVSSTSLQAALRSGNYLPTTDPAHLNDFGYAVITVPTPLKESIPDLSFIEESGETIAPYIQLGSTVILESTTYPGTTEQLLVPILENGSALQAGTDFFVGYSPERIDPGNERYGFVNTPKVVSGINATSLDSVSGLYSSLVDTIVPVSTPKEAELTKLLENTFRHVNIALVNELAVFAHALEINIWEAIDAASTKPFGFMPFTPGPGVGGHCLPVDPSYLSWQVRRSLGHNFRFVELANDVNDHMPDHVVARLAAGLNDQRKPLNGSEVLLVGIAYKKNTGDVRESPAMKVAELLAAQGAHLSVVDPFVEAHRLPSYLKRVELSPESPATYDAIVILTDHDDLDYELIKSSSAYVLDTRRRLRGTRDSL